MNKEEALKAEFDRGYQIGYLNGYTYGMEKSLHVDVFKVIDDLYDELDKKSATCTYTLDGETITTDVGYAYLGIEFFIKHLKKRLGGDDHD